MILKPRDIAQISLFAALTAIGAFIRIPLPFVPFTLQTFFVSLAGVLLGSKKGMLSQLLYVCIGLIGIPVFTNGGGIGYVLQPSFGYLLGFIVSAYVTGILIERVKKVSIFRIFAITIAGLCIVYAVGVPYLYLITNFYAGRVLPIDKAIYYGFVVFIGGNLVSLYLASVIAAKLLPILERAGLVTARETIRG